MTIKTQTPLLKFRDDARDLREALSVALLIDNHLWVASDELTSIERLSTKDGITFEDHKTFPLDKIIKLPAEDTDFDQEIDIEGMAYQDDYPWVIGSHSIKRKNLKKNKPGSSNPESDEEKIKKLTTVERDGNRYLLARIPLVKNEETGESEPRESWPEENPTLFAARLTGDTRSSALTDALSITDSLKDNVESNNHIGPFLSIPGKDNGDDCHDGRENFRAGSLRQPFRSKDG